MTEVPISISLAFGHSTYEGNLGISKSVLSFQYVYMPVPIFFTWMGGTEWAKSFAQGLNTMGWRLGLNP